MSRNPFDEAIEYALSLLPEDVVRHFTNAQREFLLGVKSTLDHVLGGVADDLDAYAEGAEAKRRKRQKAETGGTRVTVEEEEDGTEDPTDETDEAEPSGTEASA